MSLLKTCCLAIIATGFVNLSAPSLHAFQEIAQWRLFRMPTTKVVEYESTELVEETTYEEREVETQEKIWQIETRYRPVTRMKPVEETKQRVERRTIVTPEKVTRYRDRQVEETDYRTVTRYREEPYTVQKPVIETRFRERDVTVRKPVTETMIEVNETTSYKPVVETQTEYVPVPQTGVALQPAPTLFNRPRLTFLRPGYYTDPVTGLSVYRRPGLHWAQPTTVVPVAETAPVLVPRTTAETRYIPETVRTRRPVETTRMVEQTVTERVPYDVETYTEETRTRRVPYTVEEPVTRIRTEKVPYTETVYREKVIEDVVPYTETRMKQVTEYEEYEVEVARWVPKTEVRSIPKKTMKRVPVTKTRTVPGYKLVKIPFDADGNQIGPPVDLDDDDPLMPTVPADQIPTLNGTSEDVGTTQNRVYRGQPTIAEQRRRETQRPIVESVPTEGSAELKSMKRVDGAKSILETSGREAAGIPAPSMPSATDSNLTGDESAADRENFFFD